MNSLRLAMPAIVLALLAAPVPAQVETGGASRAESVPTIEETLSRARRWLGEQ